MILPVLQYPDPRLARVCEPIPEITDDIRVLAENMAETMYARDGIGLAAPQVNMPIKLVVIDLSGPEKRTDLMVLVNPVLSLQGDILSSEEGCLSVIDYRACVDRYEYAHLEATNLAGDPISLDAEDMLAICLQHECDHLEGKLFIDRIGRLKRAILDRKFSKKTTLPNE